MAGQMGSRSNYSDPQDVEFVPTTHQDRRYSSRSYAPNDGESDGGGYSKLAEESLNGDWSWKRERDARLGGDFKTFRGVPPGAAELAAGERHLRGERGARRFGDSATGTIVAVEIDAHRFDRIARTLFRSALAA